MAKTPKTQAEIETIALTKFDQLKANQNVLERSISAIAVDTLWHVTITYKVGHHKNIRDDVKDITLKFDANGSYVK